MSTKKRRPKYIVIDSVDEIPQFQSEDEEDLFWSTHTTSLAMMERAGNDPDVIAELQALDALLPPSNRDNLEVIKLGLDKDVLARLRAMGRAERTGSRTIIRRFIAEGLARLDAAADAERPAEHDAADAREPAGRAG